MLVGVGKFVGLVYGRKSRNPRNLASTHEVCRVSKNLSPSVATESEVS